ncbi:hypothetical protein ACS0TY_006264 [Phlomoides rotata]
MNEFSIPLLRLLTSSSLDSGYIFGWLITGSFGLFALVYAFLKSVHWLKASSSLKKQAWKKLKVPLSHHTWMNDVVSGGQPFTCCSCLTSLVYPQTSETISMSRSPIHRCCVCGAAAHFHCSQFAAKDCKCVAQSGCGKVQHHWSERWFNLDDNPETSAFCFYCDEPCGIPSIDAPPAWYCLWCQRSIHVKCQAIMSEEYGDICDLGAHRRLILSPLCVRRAESEKLNSITEEIIASTVYGQSRRKWYLNKRGSNESNACDRLKKYIIHDLPPDSRPLLVFINAKSGTQNGPVLQRWLNMLLNPVQVIELSSSQGPEAGLELFSNVQLFLILVCGGDGTVAWVHDAIERYNYASPPALAVLPLGTVNDLSRVLHWGGGFSVVQGQDALSTFLNDIDHAVVTMLDRWKVNVTDEKSGGKPSKVKSKFMMNYLGIGCDARVAYEFHMNREEKSGKFYNQLVNELRYAKEGSRDMMDIACADLPWEVWLEVDEKDIKIPKDAEDLIVLNIGSYMGGVDLWQNDCEHDDSFNHQCMHDKILEVVCVTGSWHLGKLQVPNFTSALLAQGKAIRIHLSSPFPMQIDGEPFIQQPGCLEITHHGQVAMLQRTSGTEGPRGHVTTEFLVDAQHNGGISRNRQHTRTCLQKQESDRSDSYSNRTSLQTSDGTREVQYTTSSRSSGSDTLSNESGNEYSSYTSNSEEDEDAYSSSSLDRTPQVTYSSSSKSEGYSSYEQPTRRPTHMLKHSTQKKSGPSRTHKSYGIKNHEKHFGAWKKVKDRLTTVFHRPHHHHHRHGDHTHDEAKMSRVSSLDKHKGEVINLKKKDEAYGDMAIEKTKKSLVRVKGQHSHLHGLVQSLLRHIRHSKKLKSGKKSVGRLGKEQHGRNKIVNKSHWWRLLQHHHKVAKLHNKTHKQFLRH